MSKKQKILSFSAIGLDSPGLVSKITTRAFELNGNIIDVEENCRRGLFSIFLIIDFTMSDRSMEEIAASLEAMEKETDLKVNLTLCDGQENTRSPEHENHLVTIIGLDQPGIISKISTFFYKKNINIENCKMIARGRFFSMEMIIDTHKMYISPSRSRKEALEKMKNDLKEMCAEINQSVVIQSENIYERTKKLVVFDLESTLIQDFSLENFLNKIKGRVEYVGKGFDFPENSEDQMEALIENAKILKGVPLRDLRAFSEIIQLKPGSIELINILKSMGFKIALLSTGFNFFIRKIFETSGVDYAFSNALKADDNGLTTGELEDPIVTSETKNELLEFIMNVESIKRDQVIAIGDGSNRSHFIKDVGLSIAFKPDDSAIKTDGVLSSDQIINILYCLGIPKNELNKHFLSA
ncbi:MAG: HAD-IB family phosphatase [Desulfobacterales bacterium]|nr:HAD-IB family phosphatase [Desulfobacterales bacterium]